MALLPSGQMNDLGAFGVSGWSAIYDTNFQVLDAALDSLLNATTALGATAVTDVTLTVVTIDAPTAVAITDSTTGTASQTVNDVGASYTQSTLNDNFASILDDLEKNRSDVAGYKDDLAKVKTDLETIRTKVNDLLSALRKTGGCGVLSD